MFILRVIYLRNTNIFLYISTMYVIILTLFIENCVLRKNIGNVEQCSTTIKIIQHT